VAQVFDELRVHDHTFVVGDVGAFEKPAQGLSDRRFRNAILLDEQIFQLDALLERILDGFDQFSLPDEALIDEEIKGAWIDRLVDVSLHDHVDTVHPACRDTPSEAPADVGRVCAPVFGGTPGQGPVTGDRSEYTGLEPILNE
jgi:hypothetical protein